MRALALLTLIAFTASAQEAIPSDKPTIASVKSGKAIVSDGTNEAEVLLPSGVFLNDLGMEKLNKSFQGLQVQIIETKAQNEALRLKVDEQAAEPKLTLGAVILIAAGALAVGAGVSAGVVYAVKK